MDKRFLRLYNEELQYIREHSGEFAAEYPKIAGRLGLDKEGKEACADPFVERLLEGFAFLTARVRHKFDAEFPRFTQAILETVYPHYLAPTPSMLIARVQPDFADGALLTGHRIPRGTLLRSTLGKGERTPCEYRTAHETTLWAVRLAEAQYYTRDIGSLNLPPGTQARAALRLRFEITAGGNGEALRNLPHLDLYIRGTDEMPVRIYEQVVGRQCGGFIRQVDASGRIPPARPLAMPVAKRVGFEEDEAMLPPSPRTFEGYRLLQEYMVFPQRFLFFRIPGIGAALAGMTANAFDVILLLQTAEPLLDGRVDRSTFDLYCVPAINLTRRRADRIQLTSRFSEYQVITDRTRPLDFEVYRVEKVTGIGARTDEEQEFQPFFLARQGKGEGGAYFTANRVPRTISQQEKRFGKATSYSGTEVYLSLVDARAAPFSSDLRQLAVEVLVSNRHLPLQMAFGLEKTDFFLEGGGPVQGVHCITGPTAPRAPAIDGEALWRIISHLSLNYFSVVGDDAKAGPVAFREILRLYADPNDRTLARLIEGVKSIVGKSVVRRVETGGPITFARGTQLAVTLDETAFEGTGIFVFGAVLERFFAKYASVNSFTETVVVSAQRGEVMRWPMQNGRRPLL